MHRRLHEKIKRTRARHAATVRRKSCLVGRRIALVDLNSLLSGKFHLKLHPDFTSTKNEELTGGLWSDEAYVFFRLIQLSIFPSLSTRSERNWGLRKCFVQCCTCITRTCSRKIVVESFYHSFWYCYQTNGESRDQVMYGCNSRKRQGSEFAGFLSTHRSVLNSVKVRYNHCLHAHDSFGRYPVFVRSPRLISRARGSNWNFMHSLGAVSNQYTAGKRKDLSDARSLTSRFYRVSLAKKESLG